MHAFCILCHSVFPFHSLYGNQLSLAVVRCSHHAYVCPFSFVFLRIQKVRTEYVDSCYWPIIQSGGSYNLKPSAQSNSELLHSGVIICSFGASYRYYCRLVCWKGRTVLHSCFIVLFVCCIVSHGFVLLQVGVCTKVELFFFISWFGDDLRVSRQGVIYH